MDACSGKTGGPMLLATLSLTAGWCFNVAAFSVCRFVKNEAGFFGNALNDDLRINYVGLYTFEDVYGNCVAVNWNEESPSWPYWADRKMNSARGCGGCAALLGFIFMIWMWCDLCLGGGGCGGGSGRVIRKIFGAFSLICCVLSGLMFLIYQSYLCDGDGKDCGFSQGGGFTVAAIVLYFFAAVAIFAAPDPDEDDDGDGSPQEGEETAASKTDNAEEKPVEKEHEENDEEEEEEDLDEEKPMKEEEHEC